VRCRCRPLRPSRTICWYISISKKKSHQQSYLVFFVFQFPVANIVTKMRRNGVFYKCNIQEKIGGMVMHELQQLRADVPAHQFKRQKALLEAKVRSM